MRALLQRVSRASVLVEGETIASIGPGLLILVGIGHADDEATVDSVARRVVELRIFADEAGRTNRSILDILGAALVVSQFTLLGDCRKGRRPSFDQAAPPEEAERLYRRFANRLGAAGIPVATGVFRAMMQVELVNDGPVTLILDTA